MRITACKPAIEASDSDQMTSTGVVEGEEAEHAWLPIHCLKLFEPQDAKKVPPEENHGSDDPNLSACIKAAEKVLADILILNAKNNELHDRDLEDDADSDSDGGEASLSVQCLSLTCTS